MGNQGYQHYFLGANTPSGFVSRFDQLTDPEQFDRVYVLKGTPGNGKSTLLRRVAAAFEEKCGGIELIHCSFDPDSLDAVVLGDWRCVVVDGTPPQEGAPYINKPSSAPTREISKTARGIYGKSQHQAGLTRTRQAPGGKSRG